MKTTKPYIDKCLDETIYNGGDVSEIKLVTSGYFERCKIVHLEIRTVDGKTTQYRYWDEFNNSHTEES